MGAKYFWIAAVFNAQHLSAGEKDDLCEMKSNFVKPDIYAVHARGVKCCAGCCGLRNTVLSSM